jgi:predicted negative regulator of RcsB-dependent stress response
MPENTNKTETEKTAASVTSAPAPLKAAIPESVRPQIQELEDLKEVARIYGARVLIVVAACVLGIGGYVFTQTNQKNKIEEASSRLGLARQMQDLEAVAAQYPSTPAAPLAVIQLAKSYYDNGDYDMALNKYMEFEQKYSKHELLPAAVMGRLHCTEARMQFQEALTGFQDFVKQYPDHSLKNFALFGQGRCLEQLGRPDEARVIYENLIASDTNQESEWVPRAEEALSDLKRNKTAKSKPVAGPADMAPVPGVLEMKPVVAE